MDSVSTTSPSTAPVAAFPGFRNRVSRTASRFRAKVGAYLVIGLVAYALPVLALVGGFVALQIFVLPRAGTAVAFMIPSVLGLLAGACALVMQSLVGSVAAFRADAGASPVRHGLRRALPLFWASLLAGAAIMTGGILIVPGIILSLRFALLAPVVLSENRGGISALGRSRDLMIGRGVRLLLESLALCALFGMATALLFVVSGIAYGVLMASGAATGSSAAIIAAKLIPLLLPVLAQVLIAPFMVTYLQVFYEDASALTPAAPWTENAKRRTLYRALAAPALALFAIFIAAFIWSLVQLARLPNTEHANGTMPATTSTSATNAGEGPAAAKPRPLGTVEERDLQRYNDVHMIKIQLGSLYNDMREYPKTLDALVPKYLAKIPADPLTGAPYAYERLDQTFKVTFSFEKGILALAPGAHYLTPDGVDIAPRPAPPPPIPVSTSHSAPAATNAPANPLPNEPLPPAESDLDGDGLIDKDEISLGTDVHVADTDADGLGDNEEVRLHKTDPLKKDSDNDGLSDGDEARVYRTNPLRADSDGDGFADADELKKGYEPNGPGPLSDERKAQIAADTATYGLR